MRLHGMHAYPDHGGAMCIRGHVHMMSAQGGGTRNQMQ